MRPRVDWGAIDLVVFDMDGTLYDARTLRGAMARRLLLEACRTRSLRTPWVLGVFRQVREALGEEAGAEFLQAQYERTAQRVGGPPAAIRALVDEWMVQRPLPLLRPCRLAHVERLFDGLRVAGKRIAVLSDYPAHDKLQVLELRADLVASACDPDIGRLKPDPRGLEVVLARAGVTPARALMVGDRFDRDAAMAQRAGVQALIRARRSHPSIATFARYDDAVFKPMLGASPASGSPA